MTNKKLWLSLLAVVLIVCMLSVGLMSCKKKTEEPEDPVDDDEVTLEEQAAEAIVEGIRNSLASADMTDLTVDGKIGLKIGDEQYDLKLALDLDLLQHNGYKYNKCSASSTFDEKTTYYEKNDDEYVEAQGAGENGKLTKAEFDANKTNYYTRGDKKDKETSTKSNTFLNAELVKDDEVLFGVYYWDSEEEVASADAYDQNFVYVQFFDKESNTTKKMAFPAPYVNATMKAMDAYVDFHGIKLDELSFWDTLDTVLPIIGSLADTTQTEFVANEKASLTINLGAILTQFSDVLSSAGGYVEPLGLDLDLSKLGDILPAISIKLAAKFDSTGKANGVELSLVIPEKEIEIKNKESEDAFLKVNISEDVNVGLSLDYTVGGTPKFLIDSFDGFVEQKNIIDVELGLDLYLSETIKMNLTDTIALEVKSGDYTAHASLALNPFCVLGDIKNLSFDGIDNIISSVKTLLDAVSSVELTLQRTADAAHEAVDEAPALRLVIADNYLPNGEIDGKMAQINTTILSGTELNLGVVDIDKAIEVVQGLIPMFTGSNENDDSASTEGEDEQSSVPPILTTIGQYLKGAYIGINDGEHSDIYVSFDTSKIDGGLIPFSGYTEYKGDLSELGNYKLYSYDETSKEYTEVAKDVAIAAVTDWNARVEADPTYKEDHPKPVYYVKGLNEEGGDFGIGLTNTSLAIEFDEGTVSIDLNATVTNLGFIGLPNSITARIHNLSIKLWQNDYFVIQENAVIKLSEVTVSD